MGYTMKETNEYEIGGICVRMTEQQAAAWNAGDTNPAHYRRAWVYLPEPGNQSSAWKLSDLLRMDAYPAGLEALEGNPANLIRIR